VIHGDLYTTLERPGRNLLVRTVAQEKGRFRLVEPFGEGRDGPVAVFEAFEAARWLWEVWGLSFES